MFISSQVHGAVATIRLQGRFTFVDHRDFRQAIKGQLEGKCTAIEIDFGRVEYMDSAALGMLLLAKEGAAAVGKTVSLINCRGDVQQVLDVANFQKLFTIR
jgi:anti-anti-sigma factor